MANNPTIGLEALFENAKFKAGLTEYVNGLGKAEKKTEGTASVLSKALGGIGKVVGGALTVAAGAAVAAVGGIAAALSQTIGPASDLNETISKVGVVFDDQAAAVLAFGETSAAALGMSTNAALAAAATYGNLFRSMGMTTKESADMSTGLVKLAADLASFNNQSPEEVLEKLRAGLTGETEPLKSLGVNLNAAAIEAKALSMGLAETTVDTIKLQAAQLAAEKEQIQYDWVMKNFNKDSRTAREQTLKHEKAQKALADAMAGSTNELTAGAKAQAAYALIMEQTSLAQGDFERTSDGLANQQRIFNAQLENLKASIGTAVLPAVNQLMTALTGFLSSPEVQEGLRNLTQWLAKNLPIAIQTASEYWTTVLWPALQQVWTWMQGSLFPTLQRLWGMIANNIGPEVSALATLWQAVLLPALTAIWNFIQLYLIPAFQVIASWLSVNVPLAVNALMIAWNTVLLPALMAVWTWIQTYLVPLFQALAEVISAVLTLAVQGLAYVWNTALLPALQAVGSYISTVIMPVLESMWSWFEEKIMPIIRKLNDFLANQFVATLSRLESYIRSVIGWLKRLAASLASINVPPNLEGHSPSPFEVSLSGINDAVKQVTKALTPLQMNLNRVGATSGLRGASGITPAASSTTNNNVFNMGGQTINNGFDVASLRSLILETVREAI